MVIAALTNSGLPAMLGACKCDSDEDDWEVNADELANHRFFKPCIGQYKISVDRPDVSRACLHGVIRAAVAHRRGKFVHIFCGTQLIYAEKLSSDEHGEMISRRRAQSAANLEAPDPSGGRPLSEHSRHSRASSDFSILRAFPNPQSGDNYRTQTSRSPRPGQNISDNQAISYRLQMTRHTQTNTISQVFVLISLAATPFSTLTNPTPNPTDIQTTFLFFSGMTTPLSRNSQRLQVSRWRNW